jgi:hypothetical protein
VLKPLIKEAALILFVAVAIAMTVRGRWQANRLPVEKGN